MAIRYDLLEPQKDLNAALDELTSKFAPLYTENWVKHKAALHGNPPFNMNVNVFTQMWLSKAMRIFMAYEDDEPVGYLLAMVFRPLPYQANVLQVEDWFAYTADSEAGLFNYMQSVLRFMGIDELWISRNSTKLVPRLEHNWHLQGTTVIDRYIK